MFVASEVSMYAVRFQSSSGGYCWLWQDSNGSFNRTIFAASGFETVEAANLATVRYVEEVDAIFTGRNFDKEDPAYKAREESRVKSIVARLVTTATTVPVGLVEPGIRVDPYKA